jgi:hypothetical protein
MITQDGEDFWFFKLMAKASLVGQVEAAFKEWALSVSIKDGIPHWRLPEGWEHLPASGMRYATIKIPVEGEEPMEGTVTKLSVGREITEGADGLEAYANKIADNVNRWRQQIGLHPSQEPFAGAEVIELVDRQGAWINVIGTVGPTTPAMPPFASAFPRTNPTPKLLFQKPSAWRDGKRSSMRLASFNAGPEERPVEITVIRAGGDPESNVHRWLGQIRKEVEPELLQRILDAVKEVPVGDQTGRFYRLDGENEDATYAIIIPAGTESMFVKMTGSARTVREVEPDFLEFAASLRFDQGS